MAGNDGVRTGARALSRAPIALTALVVMLAVFQGPAGAEPIEDPAPQQPGKPVSIMTRSGDDKDDPEQVATLMYAAADSEGAAGTFSVSWMLDIDETMENHEGSYDGAFMFQIHARVWDDLGLIGCYNTNHGSDLEYKETAGSAVLDHCFGLCTYESGDDQVFCEPGDEAVPHPHGFEGPIHWSFTASAMHTSYELVEGPTAVDYLIAGGEILGGVIITTVGCVVIVECPVAVAIGADIVVGAATYLVHDKVIEDGGEVIGHESQTTLMRGTLELEAVEIKDLELCGDLGQFRDILDPIELILYHGDTGPLPAWMTRDEPYDWFDACPAATVLNGFVATDLAVNDEVSRFALWFMSGDPQEDGCSYTPYRSAHRLAIHGVGTDCGNVDLAQAGVRHPGIVNSALDTEYVLEQTAYDQVPDAIPTPFGPPPCPFYGCPCPPMDCSEEGTYEGAVFGYSLNLVRSGSVGLVDVVEPTCTIKIAQTGGALPQMTNSAVVPLSPACGLPTPSVACPTGLNRIDMTVGATGFTGSEEATKVATYCTTFDVIPKDVACVLGCVPNSPGAATPLNAAFVVSTSAQADTLRQAIMDDWEDLGLPLPLFLVYNVAHVNAPGVSSPSAEHVLESLGYQVLSAGERSGAGYSGYDEPDDCTPGNASPMCDFQGDEEPAFPVFDLPLYTILIDPPLSVPPI